MKRLILLISLVYLVVSCRQPGQPSSSTEALLPDTILYAQGFSIHTHDHYKLVEVRDPWDSTRLLQRYVLVDRHLPLPEDLPRGLIVRTPLQNVVVYSSVHASIIEELGEIDRIVGVCEPQYMESPGIRRGLRTGRIADLGMSTAPNVEKMIDISAECIIASPFQNSNYGQAEKLGIPIIEAADYMEALPLGRAEWGRFYGLLFCQQAKADSIFRVTEKRYMELKTLAETAADRPSVFSEKRYGSFWYIPGNDSYVAHFFRDAGAMYRFGNIPGQGSTPLAFEKVLDQAIHADFWLIKYNQAEEMSYEDLRIEYTPYENFDAFKRRNIYTCNTGKTPYYEEFPIHPDYLLKDLIHVFHPDLLPGYTPRYYRRMAED
ncbi:MAG: ABC transporter substrate-binding protein [Tannerellaceae bacterium]|jgi:iron complex transport system substrate-binding protein|nr:ABC transporter substrate-binding protein [Tannerellaceae bacterium]